MAAPTTGMLCVKVCSLCSPKSYVMKKSLQKPCRILISRGLQSTTSGSAIIELDPMVTKDLQDKLYKHRKHPGVLTLKSISLPERLQNAVQTMIDKYPSTELRKNAEKFCRYLRCRKPPEEQNSFRKKAMEIEQRVRETEAPAAASPLRGSEEWETTERNIQGKVMKELRRQVYHWKSIEYTAYKGFLYMVGKMDQDYATVIRCLHEIRKRDPSFLPYSVFDFGSGVGSVTWAVNESWGKAVNEIYCVDSSGEMNTLARLLLQDGEDNKEMSIPGVYFRQFQPSIKNMFDLTISAYTLFEFPSKAERLEAVRNIWHMTNDFMILIENSSFAGFKLIQEAKECILKDQTLPEGHVFAPCPHNEVCPKLSWSKQFSCTTDVKYKKLQLSTNTDLTDTVGFSYVIMRKGKKQADDIMGSWPRLVKPSSKPRNHTPCTICCPDGSIRSFTITPSKHSKDLYSCSRYCEMGDLLPVRLPEQQKSSNHDSATEVNSEKVKSKEEKHTNPSTDFAPT